MGPGQGHGRPCLKAQGTFDLERSIRIRYGCAQGPVTHKRWTGCVPWPLRLLGTRPVLLEMLPEKASGPQLRDGGGFVSRP